MPSAKLFLVVLVLCLVSCSADRYYFRQRIGHAENTPVQKNNERVEVENPVPILISANDPDTLLPLQVEETEGLSPELSTTGTKKTADREPTTIENKKETPSALIKPVANTPVQLVGSNSNSEYGLDVWMIVLMVAVGIFLISTCCALILGYSIGHACLIGLKVLAIIILIIVYLIVEILLTPRHHYH